jgi:hypothetical protein
VPKRGTFLLVVQTAVLANATSVASQPEKAAKYHHEVSALGVLELMSKAVAVSDNIPKAMSAAQAASEFCHYMLDHLRDARRERDGSEAEPPKWFSDLPS